MVSTLVKISILILLIIPGLHIPKTRATIAAASLSAAASIAAISLSYWQHCRSPRPSTLLSLFLGLSLPLNAVRARTIWAVQTQTFFIVFVVGLGVDLVKFVLESLERNVAQSESGDPLSGETTGNVFNRNFFWWLNPLLLRGFHEVLEADKLIAIDERVNNESDSDIFARKWDAGLLFLGPEK